MPPQMEYQCEERRIPPMTTSHGQKGTVNHEIKCVLVGDGAVGKTSLIVSYTTNGYPTEYLPTAFDTFSALVQVDDTPVRIQLCDTAGQEEFDCLRSLCYPGTDVFIVCFSVVNPSSFQNITEKWIPEIRVQPSTPIILVGTRQTSDTASTFLSTWTGIRVKPVHASRARSLVEKIRAQDYVECSALTQKNLKEVFDTAIFAAIKHKARQEKKLKMDTHKMKTLSKGGWKKFFCFV
ncbi:rho-related GTP-binding protein RhoU-like [Huso huso]|uniref:Rho-related GTP-binding protein RhoU-like n=1 Tax=Huso huso TaxID=61971 RepID=A0ABR0Y1D2_HUSHU